MKNTDEPQRRIMKVLVTIEVEVDRDNYDAEYGTTHTAAEVREFVKAGARDAVDMAYQFTDAIRIVQ